MTETKTVPVPGAKRVRTTAEKAALVQPTGLGVLVQQNDAMDRTEGGVYIPETGQERPHSGKVFAVGPGAWVDGRWQDPTIKVGDRVLYRRYAGAQVKVEGVQFQLLEHHDCLATIANDDVAIA